MVLEAALAAFVLSAVEALDVLVVLVPPDFAERARELAAVIALAHCKR